MTLHSTVLTFVSMASVCAIRASAGDLAIKLNVDKQTAAEIKLNVAADSATAIVGKETERFDLKKMSWLDAETNQWITIGKCKEWAAQSKAKSQKTVEVVPPHIRPFLLWAKDPAFHVDKSNGELRLISGQVDYVIEGVASKVDVDAYYRYAVLNAYKKAMTEKKLPPFAELNAIDEMKALGYIPRKISVTIPGIPGAPAIAIEITESHP